MIQLVLSILLSVGLFALLYLLWLRDPSRAEGGAEALFRAQSSLNALKSGLLPGALIGRLFAQEDFHFIASSSSATVQSLFIKERKKLALRWISEVRSQILSLRRFHLGQSRFYASLSFKTEMTLALAFSLLLVECRVLQVLVYLRGPYAFPRFVGRTISAASRVCSISERSIAFLSLSNGKMSSGGGTENQPAL